MAKKKILGSLIYISGIFQHLRFKGKSQHCCCCNDRRQNEHSRKWYHCFRKLFFYSIYKQPIFFLQYRDFDWDSKQQGFILSSFFYGYILTQFAGGWLAAKYGGRRIYGVGLVVTAILTILTPFAAKQNFYLLIFVRVLEGLFEVTSKIMYFYKNVFDLFHRE